MSNNAIDFGNDTIDFDIIDTGSPEVQKAFRRKIAEAPWFKEASEWVKLTFAMPTQEDCKVFALV